MDLNGQWIEASDDEVYDLVMAVASGAVDLRQITATLARWH